MSFKDFIRLAFSEKESPSSKRIVGALMSVASIIFVGYICFNYGCNDCSKDLIQTLIFCSLTLLGISSVTGIFNGKSNKNE